MARHAINIYSPMPSGSGAIIVHRMLEAAIPSYHLRPYSPTLQYFPPLLSSLRNPSAQIVHSTPDQGDLIVSREQLLIITFHNFVLDKFMRQYSSRAQKIHYATDLKWLIRRATRKAAVITAVSRFTGDRVEEFFSLPDGSVTVIPNGVDTSRFHDTLLTRTDGAVRVLVSGNASLRKGTHWIGDIARQLDPGIEIICTLAPEQLARWTPPLKNIRSIGKRGYDAMPDLYRNSDILLMPTVREGMSLAALEAMASGLPLVTSANSSMSELVIHGLGGVLCETGNADEYAAAINHLAADPQLRKTMGTYNRDKAVKEFSADAMINAYDALFREVEERSRSSSDSSRRR